MKETLVKSICQYVSNPFVQYALLIDGPWGCGKTFYWKNRVLPILTSDEKLRSQYEGKLSTVYVSLYGVRDLEKVGIHILLQLHPKLKGKAGSILAGATRAAISYLGLESASDQVDPSNLLNSLAENRLIIICFDDLERAAISSKEMFGFINRFVEHTKAKVVLLCNEKELVKNELDADQYKKLKEKTIGSTRSFIVDIDETVRSIVNDFTCRKEFLVYLQSYVEDIISIFRLSGIDNFRQLKHSLSLLSVAFQAYMEAPYTPSKDLLLSLLPISIEYMAGRLSEEEAIRILSLGKEAQMFEHTQHGKVTHPEYGKYFQRYKIEYKTSLIHSKALAGLVVNGYLEPSEFTKDLDWHHFDESKDKSRIAMKRFRDHDFYDFSETEFKEMLEDSYRGIRNGEFRDWEALLHFSVTISDYHERGLINESLDNLRTLFSLGIEQMAQFEVESEAIDGLKLGETAGEFCVSILEELKGLRRTKLTEEFAKVFIDFSEDPKTNEKVLSSLLNASQFILVPIPKAITADAFVGLLLQCSDIGQGHIARVLGYRIQDTKNASHGPMEIAFMQEIIECLEKHRESLVGSMRLTIFRVDNLLGILRSFQKNIADEDVKQEKK